VSIRARDARAGTADRPSVVSSWFARPLTPYYVLLGATGLLTSLGLVMVFSASSVVSFAETGSSWGFGARQIAFAALGVPLMLVASRRSVTFYRRWVYPLLGLAFCLLIATLLFGVEVNGNRNWLPIAGSIRLQPSEFAKLALALWGADLLARKSKLLGHNKHMLIPLLPVAAALMLLVLLGGDLGTAIVLMTITAALLFFGGARWSPILGLSAAAVGGIMALSLTTGYRKDRLTSWLDPSSDPLGAGWQALHGSYALSSGGWWGLGLGGSREKWGALPEAHTDFIFAIIGEELGLVGTMVVVLLVAAIAIAGFRVAMVSNDVFVRLAASAITCWFLVQSIINLGAVLGIMPITGLPLPLVSYGGSALLMTLVALGVLMALARQEPAAAAALRLRGPHPVRRRIRALVARGEGRAD